MLKMDTGLPATILRLTYGFIDLRSNVHTHVYQLHASHVFTVRLIQPMKLCPYVTRSEKRWNQKLSFIYGWKAHNISFNLVYGRAL